ncbi:ABC transporter permease [Caulobacter sp.]|uniref:ABC transporter permease n=1 Tax=Caulobacter sp. TaxID=78 RepID=UPI001B2E7D89|nr:ABC transporter permease [Caulobacter sp.]MBO9546995.1 ABC transporter permease [Caulobacter sp.]
MLKSYVLTLYRSLLRHKLFSALNILGLAVGLAVFLTLTIATRFELSYDRWIPNAERTFRVTGVMDMAGRPREAIAPIPGPVLPNLRAEFGPQIQAGVRLLNRAFAVRRGEQADYEEIIFADASFFDVFDLPLAAGDRAQALAGPGKLVLSQTAARKYFGEANAMGERLTLTLDGQPRDYVVAAVLKDLPENTHLKIDFLALLDRSVLPESAEYLDQWNATNYLTYVRLPRAAAATPIDAALADVMRRRGGGDVHEWLGLKLEPLTDLHFNAEQMGQFKPGVDRRFVITLQVIGVLTLGLAIINYVNLSTARAVLRAREVGLRKAFGATRSALMAQFLIEAVIVSLVSALIALALVELSLPLVNSALGGKLQLHYLGADGVLRLLIPVAVLVGLAAGIYPALVLSRYEPAAVLASAKAPGGGRAAALVREVLVVAQFSVSIALLIATAVVFAQAQFVRRAELGFQRQGLIVVPGVDGPDILPRRDTVLAAFRRTDGVTSATISGRYPGRGGVARSTKFTRTGSTADPSLSMEFVAPDYFKTLGMGVAAGRPLDKTNALDDLGRVGAADKGRTANGVNVVINQAAAKALEFSTAQAAVGQWLRVGDDELRIVGVMKDARYGSPREKVPPLVYFLNSAPGASLTGLETLIVRYDGDPGLVMERLARAWRQTLPNAPFKGQTVEAALDPFYQPDERRARLITLGAVVACLIGCLGLYGLAAFNSERRTKEIGIRKVLGASTADIFRLLAGQFLRPVLIANLVAWPLAYGLMREWLNGFDQRISLGLAYFALATLLALLVALLTVCGQAFKVARADPAAALRYE